MKNTLEVAQVTTYLNDLLKDDDKKKGFGKLFPPRRAPFLRHLVKPPVKAYVNRPISFARKGLIARRFTFDHIRTEKTSPCLRLPSAAASANVSIGHRNTALTS